MGPDSYQGLLMRCAPGVHEASEQILLRNGVKNGPVLDLAAGSGAFLARLRNAGFTDLNAVEIDRSRFQLPGIEPVPENLNNNFAQAVDSALAGKRFGLISAIEIIEHLDSPRHFLRELRGLLSDDGILLLTTPNVANLTGRIRFFLSGELRYFRKADYDYQRHISAITDIQMQLMLREIGFKILDADTAGTFYGPAKRAVLGPAIALAKMFWGPLASREVRIYLAQKAEPDASSPGRSSGYVATGG
jgi:2-polyprenyl-3-methyl-5-hydroxy-6-metoxy-1,4-benzoquinol methylase